MKVSAKRMAVLREHVRAESEHDMEALLSGMTPDCFNDVVGVPKPFVGPEQTAERYRRHWEGFPDVPAAFSVPTSLALSPRTSGGGLTLGRFLVGRRPESRCACARS
jgi:hypothetical protein